MDDNRASSILPKLCITSSGVVVGEHSNGIEVNLRGFIELLEKKM